MKTILGLLGFWTLAIGLWVANLVQVFGMGYDNLSVLALLKIVGVVVPPLGSLLGLVGLF